MAFQALRGTSDLLADELARWQTVEQTARALASRYGYQEIRTPIIEDAAVFQRSVGETSNIVQKEMFLFEDRGGRSIVLRPEGTAAIVRAYLEHHLDKIQGLAKLFYLGPMFRAERPQAGRFRQFHQFGVEALGSSSAFMDAEVITLCVRILETCGVADATVLLASMGCRDDQQRSAEALRKRLEPHKSTLCEECQARLDRNVFRILDCKKPGCRELAWSGQGSPFLLCDDCTRHHATVRDALTKAGVKFDESQTFARGLDYYTRTVFEVRAAGLGAQDAVAAGGRYDHLVEEFGGPQVGSVGFAAGIERLLIAAGKQAPSATAKPRSGLYLAAVKPEVLGEVFALAEQLRRRGVTALIDADGRSLKAQLREADKFGCRWVAVIGENELRDRQVAVKDLDGGEQRTMSLDEFVSARFAC